MISHGKDIKIFTGNANPALAKEICQIIGTKLGDAEVTHFADGEALSPCTRLFAAAMSFLSTPPASPSTTASWSCSS